MPHISHPFRVLAIDDIEHKRFDAAGERILQVRRSTDTKQLPVEVNAIGRWVLSKEYSAMTPEEEASRYAKVKDFIPLALDTRTNVYDVSVLVQPFSRLDVEETELTGLELPKEAVFIEFGVDAHLHLENVPGTYIEGAYVIQHRDQDYSGFYVYLTCSDPAFFKAASVPFGETLKKVTRYAEVNLPDGYSIEESLKPEFVRGDPEVLSNMRHVLAAFSLVAKSMIYLGGIRPDIEMDYQITSSRKLVALAKEGDVIAHLDLFHKGFPPVHFCGRNTSIIHCLENPALCGMEI